MSYEAAEPRLIPRLRDDPCDVTRPLAFNDLAVREPEDAAGEPEPLVGPPGSVIGAKLRARVDEARDELVLF